MIQVYGSLWLVVSSVLRPTVLLYFWILCNLYNRNIFLFVFHFRSLTQTSENEAVDKTPVSPGSARNVFFGPDFPKTITDLNRPFTAPNKAGLSADLLGTTRGSAAVQFRGHGSRSASNASSCLSTPTSSILLSSPQSRITPIAPKSPATAPGGLVPTDPTVVTGCRFTPSKSVVEMRRKLVLDLFKQHGLFPSSKSASAFYTN